MVAVAAAVVAAIPHTCTHATHKRQKDKNPQTVDEQNPAPLFDTVPLAPPYITLSARWGTLMIAELATSASCGGSTTEDCLEVLSPTLWWT